MSEPTDSSLREWQKEQNRLARDWVRGERRADERQLGALRASKTRLTWPGFGEAGVTLVKWVFSSWLLALPFALLDADGSWTSPLAFFIYFLFAACAVFWFSRAFVVRGSK